MSGRVELGRAGRAAAVMRARGMSEAQIRRNLGLRPVSAAAAARAALEAAPEAIPVRGHTPRRAGPAGDAPERVVRAVAEAAGLEGPAALFARGRDHERVRARQLAMYLIRARAPEATFAWIGNWFGYDKQTALYGVGWARDLLISDARFRALRDAALARLRGPGDEGGPVRRSLGAGG